MSKEEFDSYLKTIGGVYNWKGIDHTDSNIFGVKSGWFELLKDLIDELLLNGWDRHLYQSKEKFGGLNFYIKNNSDVLQDIILKYEKKSFKICERCGEPGERRSGGWIRTLCDEHAIEQNYDI